MITTRTLASTLTVLVVACGGTVRFDDDVTLDTGQEFDDIAMDTVPSDVAPDTSPDAIDDAPGDAEPDTPDDTAIDTATDGPVDTATDTWPDITLDTWPDTAVDTRPDTPVDVPLDAPCSHEGCPASTTTEPACCPGLTAVSGCEPGYACPDPDFCVSCGDDSCDANETSWNCWNDCPAGCTEGEISTSACSPIETWICSCVEDPCKPVCDLDGLPPDGWIDPCTHTWLAACSGPTATIRCMAIGSFSEGWYEVTGSGTTPSLVAWDICSNRWDCNVVW